MLCSQYPWHLPLCDLLAIKRSHASVTINSTAISLLVYLSWDKNIVSTKVPKISSKVKDISSSTSLTCKKVLRGHCINKSISFSELSNLAQTNVILSSHNELIIACAPSELARLASFVLKVWLRP